jgi:N-acetylneuraminic acid mutarotase
VAVLGDELYVMGGSDDNCITYLLKTAERYDSRANKWSLIADMKVCREAASATALNGNMNIMKQEGIRTKCVAK